MCCLVVAIIFYGGSNHSKSVSYLYWREHDCEEKDEHHIGLRVEVELIVRRRRTPRVSSEIPRGEWVVGWVGE